MQVKKAGHSGAVAAPALLAAAARFFALGAPGRPLGRLQHEVVHHSQEAGREEKSNGVVPVPPLRGDQHAHGHPDDPSHHRHDRELADDFVVVSRLILHTCSLE